jgi:transaldolase
MNQLEQLSQHSVVVADTGDFDLLKKYNAIDCTTNPTLIYRAALMPEYQHIVREVVDTYGGEKGSIQLIMDNMSVRFGKEILQIVPGWCSTEVDANLSYSVERTVEKARELIRLYRENGVDTDRILIKLASTWEGIRACEILEKEGIRCNMTLVFSLEQAIACAESGATLISPFVGRILDWHRENGIVGEQDPGVVSVRTIYSYFKKFGYKTIVMGASFRNKQEILDLAGCDRLTIAPSLLEELISSNDSVENKMQDEYEGERIYLDESEFRKRLEMNKMANEKLTKGIEGFINDTNKLRQYINDIMSQ